MTDRGPDLKIELVIRGDAGLRSLVSTGLAGEREGLMIFLAGFRTDRGLVREQNEDSFFVSQRCLAVADGMGGHQSGEVASKMAIDAVRSLPGPVMDDAGWRELFCRINRQVLEAEQQAEIYKGMGTTLTVASIGRDGLLVAHAGDSRCYVVDQDGIRQITEDHSLVQHLVMTGTITEEEAMSHRSRNLLTNAIGVDEETRVDVINVAVTAGDVVIMCTDGLSSLVTRQEILDVVRHESNVQRAADRLVDLAIQRGGDDNITVIVARVSDDEVDQSHETS